MTNEEVLQSQIKKLAVLKSTREKLFAQVQNCYDSVKRTTVDTALQFKPRYEKLEVIEIEMDKTQNAIIQLNADLLDNRHALEVCKVQTAFDDLVFNTRGRYLDLVKTQPPQQTSSNSVANSNQHLPRINIPTFTGRIEEWSAFFSLFDSVVHKNDALSEAEKFQYLRSYLRDDALTVIANFHLTPENYALAYEALQLRYQNKRRLATHCVNQILGFTPLSSPSSSSLRHFLNIHSNSINALKALNLQDLGDFLLFQLSFANLDPVSRKAFENRQSSNSVPSYQALIDFITDQNRTYELLSQDTKSPKCKSLSVKSFRASLMTNAKSDAPYTCSVPCVLCKGSHPFPACSEFLQKTNEQKYDTLKRLRRCFNCLGAHNRNECQSRKTSRICHSNKHHSVLHQESKADTSETSTSPSVEERKSPVVFSCKTSAERNTVLLATVTAQIQDCNGDYHKIRAVVDPGSQVSVITSSTAQHLGLKRSRSPIEVTGIASFPVRTQGLIRTTLRSRTHADVVNVHAVVLSDIPNKFPSQTLPSHIKDQFSHLTLADENFHQAARVEFLIGADLYPHILCNTQPNVIQGQPSAIDTIFGWIIIGSISSSTNSPLCSLLTCTDSLDDTVRNFWETETLADNLSVSNPEDDFCQAHFKDTHYRDRSGRYVVSMPVREQRSPLLSNRETTLNTYLKMEARMSRRPQLNAAYITFLQEYRDLGHMQLAAQPSMYVMPHHCVQKETSSTTKVRVVFNGSSPDSNGTTLNQQLLPGPKLQKDLSHILMNFRLHAIAVTADIRQMYRQIWLNPKQRYLQHIFWRPDPASNVQEYELKTVTYGLAPSAYLAQRVLLQLVEDEGHEFPLAVQAITESTYVDDIAHGASTVEEAKSLQLQLANLLTRGGFQLRKWASNDPIALDHVPEQHRESPLNFSSDDPSIKILGLRWDPRSDTFTYYVQEFDSQVTKRTVLSYIARVFDPMGWLSPIVFWAKHFLQQIWISKVGYDDILPPSLSEAWGRFSSQMRCLRALKIPRYILQSLPRLLLVGFSDASSKGYSACIYLHAYDSSSTCSNHLLKAKNKVAPLKTLTIPRLELCGALLLSRLLRDVIKSLKAVRFENVHLYTDSQIVLAWLHTSPHLLKTYVANRVVRILEHTSLHQWAHTVSNQNSADFASRGLFPEEIMDCHSWWNGPDFMQNPPSKWPVRGDNYVAPEELPERKNDPIVLRIQADPENPLYEVVSRFSSFSRLQRAFAFIRRWLLRIRCPEMKGPLSSEEMRYSTLSLVRLTQQNHFPLLIEELRSKGHTTTPLRKLFPFLDAMGIVRVGGRLRHSALPLDAKHPLLLPQKAHLSALICDYYHLYACHAGPRSVQTLIQQKFWIISIRSLLRQRIFRCIRCFKFKSKPVFPFMADLPPARVQPSKPFSSVGIDFAGPFTVRESRRRKAHTYKGYLCLFICMSTKAVHLEMVSELSTKAFLASLNRFTARRGLPSDIYSDCGRNFLGAARHLREVSQFLRSHSSEITSSLTSLEIKWHFNPPAAPNFGGLWEAAIKSAKSLLYRSIGTSLLTFEEYSTLFCKIEAVLNSRPLCAVTSNPEDAVDYLSPGHFLVGRPLLQPPEAPLEDNLNWTCRWQLLSQLYQRFWKRWSTEYLHTQLQRQKWNKDQPNIQPGAIVALYGAETTPLSWPLGRVQEVHPGTDGVVRVATVKTATGLYTRPVNKLVILPTQFSMEN
ncbi:uncharacterized protein LOC135134622 [Zophobas morio]|uniref:uncharacterized protein LOC135134622 n=1 Tax=Zophobas morio TaxID=2755281 RepID=UPI003082D238